MHKKRILFVGSFKTKSEKGGVGGQMYACTSLINSHLSDQYEWVTIDSTAESNLHIAFYKRFYKALYRLILFVYHLFFSRIDSVLIFSSNGFSFLEKGMMAIIASLFPSKKVIFAPRSGRIINELNGWRLSFTRLLFKRVDYVICQGETWKDIFNDRVIRDNKSKYIIIKNWLDTSNYTRKVNTSRKVSILFLAWIEKDKGIFDLIDVVNNMVDKGVSNFTVTIAGKGKDEELAHRMVKELNLSNFIKFEGWVLGKDKIKLLSYSDIFVLPSYFEGSPNALLEAMASGLASIATNVGAIPDIIDGNNGFIFKLGEQITFQKQLELLIINKKIRMEISDKAIEYIFLNHAISIAINKFEKILN